MLRCDYNVIKISCNIYDNINEHTSVRQYDLRYTAKEFFTQQATKVIISLADVHVMKA